MKIARVYFHSKIDSYRWAFNHKYQTYRFRDYVSQSVSTAQLLYLIQQTVIELVPIPNS